MKKLNLKQRILTLSLAAILVAVSAYGTLAYFTTTDTARNVITTGSIDVEIVETSISADSEEELPFEDAIGVMPGNDISKIVRIKNTGKSAAWVRISVEKTIELAENMQGDADTELVVLDINSEDWTEADGYYYYNEPLLPEASTEPLFTTVHFDENMGNLYQESTAFIDIDAYATQTANNGTTPFEAAGWPETEEDN